MGKITTTKEELDFYKSDKAFLNQAFRNSIIAQDFTALELLFKLTNLKSCLKISSKELFYELVPLVEDDNNVNIIELIINEFKVDLREQKDSAAKATLLDQAAIYGSEKIVSFLLSKGFNPNNQDFQGQTSVHRAIIANSLPTVITLIKAKADLNVQDNQKFASLYFARLLEYTPIVNELKAAGAELIAPSGKFYNYVAFAKEVLKNKGKVTAKLVEPQPEEDKILGFYKGMADFYKAILSEKNNEKYFVGAIDGIKSFLEQLAKPSEKMSSDEMPYVINSLETLIRLYKHYQYQESAELQKYIIDKATTLELSTILTVLYNIMCIECLGVADDNNTIKYAEYAHNYLIKSFKKLPAGTYNESLYEILFNLGLAWKHSDIAKSLEYFSQAEKLTPDDQGAIMEQLNHYINNGDIYNISRQIAKIKDSAIRELYQIMLNIVGSAPNFSILTALENHAKTLTDPALQNLSTIMLQFASKQDASLAELGTFFQNNTHQNDYLAIYKEFNKAIECCNEITICCTKELNIPIKLFKILKICKEAGLWQEGLEFINQQYKQYPEILGHHTFPLLKYLEFIFYKQNGLEEKSEPCLQFLKENASLGDRSALLLSSAQDFAFYIAVEKEDFNTAMCYLNNATSLDSSTIAKIKILSSLLARLQKEQEQVPLPLAQAATIETTEENNIVSIDLMDTDELNEFIANLTPRSIHAYFQYQKKALLKKSLDTTATKEQPANWNTGKDTYVSNQQDIYSVEDKPNFYVMVDRKLKEKMDTQLLENFNNALLKGLIDKDHKSNGIKIIPNILIELKITGDERLYTYEIYKNPQGKYLIYFNKQGNHNDVKNAVKLSKGLKIIETDEISYFSSLPKEPECSTDTQNLDLEEMKTLVLHLQEEEKMKTLGDSGNNDAD
ncbi:ankyrin repeat domain-containing protein [Candidatus Tisiphia endosymbiont of Ceraclea dissimilis]|uniref:ankyrin repeat domain-containing protein n=1 Tax=Candidatus Tisiphia endosymbiont of Ceraclea dissimilis TaxID=3077928 RepID=UPI003CCB3AA3